MTRLVAALVVVAWAGPALAQGDRLTGEARVLAPETVAIQGTRFRFEGFRALPAEARCGGEDCAKAATARLAELVATGPVTCSRDARLGHGVYAGSCRLADGRDPAAILVAEGLLEPGG